MQIWGLFKRDIVFCPMSISNRIVRKKSKLSYTMVMLLYEVFPMKTFLIALTVIALTACSAQRLGIISPPVDHTLPADTDTH